MLKNNKKRKSKWVRSTCGVFGLASILKIWSN
jgi:hypothetical protein